MIAWIFRIILIIFITIGLFSIVLQFSQPVSSSSNLKPITPPKPIMVNLVTLPPPPPPVAAKPIQIAAKPAIVPKPIVKKTKSVVKKKRSKKKVKKKSRKKSVKKRPKYKKTRTKSTQSKPTKKRIASTNQKVGNSRKVATKKGVVGGQHNGKSQGKLGGQQGGKGKTARSKVTQPIKPKKSKKTVITKARYSNNPQPPYPRISRRLREEGTVKLRVKVSAAGRASAVTLNRSSGSNRLDNAAIKAVKKWRFVPAKRNGQAESSWVIIPIVFNLN